MPLPQIIQVNLTSESPQPLVVGGTLEFTYSVRWQPSSIAFSRRFERYLDYNFFEHQVRASLPIHPKRRMICSCSECFREARPACCTCGLIAERSTSTCNPAYWRFVCMQTVCSASDAPQASSMGTPLTRPRCLLQIHWFSIFNSFMMVIFLTGLVSMILLRTLRNDYAKCAAQIPAPVVVTPVAA